MPRETLLRLLGLDRSRGPERGHLLGHDGRDRAAGAAARSRPLVRAAADA
jgi:hypothetical protein